MRTNPPYTATVPILLYLYCDLGNDRPYDAKIHKDPLEIQNTKNLHETALKASKMIGVKNSDVGMLARKPILFLLLWYFFSGLTLFFNKYIVATMNGSETLLSK